MMKPLELAPLSPAQVEELDTLYRTTKDVRLRTRAQMILLAAEHKMSAPTIAALVRDAAGRLVLLYLPTYSPWLNPIERRWRHFRREVTHCELFTHITALVTAAQEFFTRYNQNPEHARSIIGAIPKNLAVCTWRNSRRRPGGRWTRPSSKCPK